MEEWRGCGALGIMYTRQQWDRPRRSSPFHGHARTCKAHSHQIQCHRHSSLCPLHRFDPAVVHPGSYSLAEVAEDEAQMHEMHLKKRLSHPLHVLQHSHHSHSLAVVKKPKVIRICNALKPQTPLTLVP